MVVNSFFDQGLSRGFVRPERSECPSCEIDRREPSSYLEVDDMANGEPSGGGGNIPGSGAPAGNGEDASGGWGLWLVGLVITAFLFIVLWSVVWVQSAMEPLRDQAFARGVITFVICMATIALAFILVFLAFFGGTDDNGFRRAREVFTVLTGILGTIVGFYFGTAGTDTQPPTVNGPRFALLADGQLNVTGHIVGGKGPYKYKLSFDPKPPQKTVNEGLSEDGWVEQAVTAVDKVSVTLQVTDSQGRTAEKTGEYEKKPPTAAPPAAGSPQAKP
jgi:hypothetical protein